MSTSQKHARILVVLPLYGGSLPIGRFCVEGLKQLGHTVEIFEAPDFMSGYDALKKLKVATDRLSYLENAYLQVLSQAILAKVDAFEPDLVLAMAQAPMSHQALKRLRKDGVATAMWFVEDFQLFPYWKSFAPFYDVFAVIQKEPFLERLQAIGVDNAVYLPLAANPDFHRPMELSKTERHIFGSDISFMGAGYPNRRLAFRKLAHKGLKIWGTEWDGDHVLEPLVQMGGKRVTPDEYIKIFNASKINLNLHSSISADQLVSNGDFINPRTFEVAACGAFQLVDKRILMPEAFDDGELATFESMEELEQKVEHYLKHPEERAAIAGKGRARVMREHTYAHRMESLLSFVAERLPEKFAPQKGRELYPEGFPEELKGEIAELLDNLGLTRAASFEDLVTAVRGRAGRLDGLEASILFLDEWRKLYGK